MVIIEAENLKKDYDGFTAVDGVSFQIKKGEIFGFLGPNGAGKTTTINMLTGLARITSGRVRLLGKEYTTNPKKAQGLMGIVPDESNLYEELNGRENLRFCGSLYGMERKEREERAEQLLKQFALLEAAEKPYKAYSKGMKRKLTIAAGIIHQPEILFLDEPTTGIDVASARQIRNLIKELNKRGTTIFLTTHYIEEAERFCSRLAFIVKGRIVREGTVADMMEAVQQENIVKFSLDNDAAAVEKDFEQFFPGYRFNITNENEVSIHSRKPFTLLPFVQFFEERDLPVYEAKIIRPSLEEVFIRVTGIELKKMDNRKEGRRR